jgi:hypothetical protein
MKAYFNADGTLVIDADTPIEAFALKQWALSRESDAEPKGFSLLIKFERALSAKDAP